MNSNFISRMALLCGGSLLTVACTHSSVEDVGSADEAFASPQSTSYSFTLEDEHSYSGDYAWVTNCQLENADTNDGSLVVRKYTLPITTEIASALKTEAGKVDTALSFYGNAVNGGLAAADYRVELYARGTSQTGPWTLALDTVSGSFSESGTPEVPEVRRVVANESEYGDIGVASSFLMVIKLWTNASCEKRAGSSASSHLYNTKPSLYVTVPRP